MSIVKVTAAVECDECGSHFLVNMDPTIKAGPEVGDTLADFVEEACCNGHTEPMRGRPVDLRACSFQDDKMLCPDCTSVFDREDDEA